MKKSAQEIVRRTCGRGTGATADVTTINGLGFKINDANINSLFARLGGAENDARYEVQRRAA